MNRRLFWVWAALLSLFGSAVAGSQALANKPVDCGCACDCSQGCDNCPPGCCADARCCAASRHET